MMLSIVTMITLSFIFMWLNHPITMGITIIAQTLTIAMITGMMMGSFLFSYIIIITMLSGMLVLFIYMASVASNEKMYTSNKLIFASTLMLMMGMITQYYSENTELSMISTQTMMQNEMMVLSTLFNHKFKMITMMLVMYLMFTMIVISFIVNISEGPLRISKK
uniref:NADH dehydrogenase subunit 6 n=1 Tax=Homoeocerus bipunctatus TaxID=3021836 RepID=UPI00237A9B30|nr:NADH dehydrogenase subunit 6 [Homoeocerus bipunctatus]WBV80563.1 NADH dehydrogenase subunit 6 [Homoeocerus bipunctatus]